MTDAARDPLDAIVERHPVPGWRLVAWAVMALLAAGLIWASQAELDVVTTAEGGVVPQGQLRVIQHLEGGIVEQIFVARDQAVAAGQPLLRLNLGAGGLSGQEMLIRRDALILKQARLEAEASGAPLVLPEEAAARQPDLAEAERAAYTSRAQALDETLGVLANQASQRRSEIAEFEAQLASVRENLRLAGAELERSRPLVARNLITRADFTALERDVESLDGQRRILTASLARARAALAEARDRQEQAVSEARSKANEELSGVRADIARVGEQMTRASDQERRTEIVSPIDGIVKNMRVFTIGGVVRPGEPIMEVVPTDDRLVVEARVSPVDIAYVEIGQRAVVKLIAFDFMRYGGLDGTVTGIAADADQDQQTGAHYFRVIVETDRADFEVEGATRGIIPGMQATADIHIGTKSVLDYMIQPVLKLRHEAFRER